MDHRGQRKGMLNFDLFAWKYFSYLDIFYNTINTYAMFQLLVKKTQLSSVSVQHFQENRCNKFDLSL